MSRVYAVNVRYLILMRSCSRHLKCPGPFPIYLEEFHFGVMNIGSLRRATLVWLLRNQTKGFKGGRRCNGNEWKYNLWQHLTHMGYWKRLCACRVDKIIFSFPSIHSCPMSPNSLNFRLALSYASVQISGQNSYVLSEGTRNLETLSAKTSSDKLMRIKALFVTLIIEQRLGNIVWGSLTTAR